MKRGEKVNWYLFALGTEIDMHNVHFHGQTVLAVCIIRLYVKLILKYLYHGFGVCTSRKFRVF